jgi:hypothetical protein
MIVLPVAAPSPHTLVVGRRPIHLTVNSDPDPSRHPFGALRSMCTRGLAVLLLMLAAACGGSNASPAAPSTPNAPTPVTTSTFHVTGTVTEDAGHPVAGATVTILNTSVSSTTDGNGFYSLDFDVRGAVTGLVRLVKAEDAGYDMSHNYLIPVSGSQYISQNIHLYRIRRITAGETAVLTVVPGDTSCGDNDQFTCRTVHIVAPSDGLMTIAAEATPAATNAGLDIVGQPSYFCCPLIVSVVVTAGTEVVANIGMAYTSTVSQSFVLNTSLVRP